MPVLAYVHHLFNVAQCLAYWILATFLLCLSCSSRRIARELRGRPYRHQLSVMLVAA
jgi:hypothetical protein